MGSVYQRGDSAYWWLSFVDASGKRRLESSKSTDKAHAEKLLAAIEKQVQRERDLLPSTELITVRQYAAKWMDERRRRGVRSVSEDEDRLRHALPVIGNLVLSQVKPHHMRDLVRELSAAKKSDGTRRFAPRTVLHVYGVLRTMFNDAAMEEVISASPCVLRRRRKELPKKTDADPTWRARAVFSADEVEQLISDERIPEYRRVLYGMTFLGCMRINEVTPRRWRDLSDGEPLGRILVATSYDLKHREEKQVKSERPREMPVHPTLAKLLAAWRLGGWARLHGRQPKDDDLIVPSESGRILNSNWTWKRLQLDLDVLGLRHRRQHDSRRTFISLARAGGADKSLLRWVTHGPETDVLDDYTTPPWPVLCDQVLKLKISLREGKVIHLPQVARGGATAVLRPMEDREMTGEKVGRRGTRILSPSAAELGEVALTHTPLSGIGTSGGVGRAERDSERSTVAALDPTVGCGR